jgi:hypothetical protein
VTERGPGWPTVLGLVLVVITFSVVNPLQLVAIPLALLLVALPPRTPTTLLVALALMVVAFSGAARDAVARGAGLGAVARRLVHRDGGALAGGDHGRKR